MAGYIGTKAVLLSTTAATVTGNADIGGDLTVDSNTLYVDAANNRVGVGTSSPVAPLDILTLAGTEAKLVVRNGTSTSPVASIELRRGATSNVFGFDSYGDYRFKNEGGNLSFEYGQDETTSERCRIDSSGNLLVGKTSSSLATDGIEAKANGSLYVTRSSATPVSFRRSTTDGDIISFYKDGTTVGSIGNTSTSLFIESSVDFQAGFTFRSTDVIPRRSGGNNDGSMDIGDGAWRFDDVYATNGTIQTSDRNEKQDIAELDEAEKRVAVAAKGLIRKYRWKDAVAEKGDEARIHVGIIAQDLQDAFAAEGLDAGRYAMFISSTWWEHDGQTYETAEEAPEGATERTRMGVRYPELLAFIIGAM